MTKAFLDYIWRTCTSALVLPYADIYQQNTRKPLIGLLQLDDDEAAFAALKQWAKRKEREANYVQVASAVLFSSIISALSWQAVENAHWSGSACWYAGIIWSLLAIVLGQQQMMVVTDVSQTSGDLTELRKHVKAGSHAKSVFGLRHSSQEGAREKDEQKVDEHGYPINPVYEREHSHRTEQQQPSHMVLFALQAPLMCLTYSIVFFLAGLASVVLSPFADNPGWNPEAKTTPAAPPSSTPKSAMNNTDFRSLVQNTPHAPQNGSPSNTFVKPSALGSRNKSSIPMTPRTLKHTPSSSDFAHQLAAHSSSETGDQPPRKKFRSSAAPKGAKYADGYVDRAAQRRDAKAEDGVEARVNALEEQVKLGQIDQKTFEDLRERITGGGEEGTRFVKGLDRKLLRACRKDEEGGSRGEGDGAERKGDTVVEEEAELDELERREVAPVQKSPAVKKGEMAPPPAPSASAGMKRSRNEILAELKAKRQAAASAEATKESELGFRFKKLAGGGGAADKKPYPRIERDDKGREVLLTMDASGKIKRKVRKAPEPARKKEDLTSHGLPMPDKDAKPLGMEVPDDVRNGAADNEPEDDDDDIFQGVGDEYDPLKAEGQEEDESTSSSSEDERKTKHDRPNPSTAAPPEQKPSNEAERKPPSPQPQQASANHNYFNDTPTEAQDRDKSKPAFSDPTILATLKRAAALRQTSEANKKNSSASISESDEDTALPSLKDKNKTGTTAEERIRARQEADRDYEDMDLDFGGSRLGDEEEFEDGKIKLSEWKGNGGGGGGADGGGKNSGKGKGKKEGSRRKKKGDKDNVADLMKVIESRKGGK
ncbi:MAG: hypothetical protein M1831_001147 [Alyxoria varia]|nr:MAG: hypothetical protein M1831_001147 [Alyxoria varia]